MSEQPLEHCPVIGDAPAGTQATILLNFVKKRLRAIHVWRGTVAGLMRTGLTYKP
jgi:hypothetical protein